MQRNLNDYRIIKLNFKKARNRCTPEKKNLR